MEKLLRLAATSLVDLIVDPIYINHSKDRQVVEMFSRLPAFPALSMLSLSLSETRQAEHILNALVAAPHLTTLIFRIILDNENDHEDYAVFKRILNTGLPLDPSMLTQKFPLIKRIGVYFCVERGSGLHFRRGLRRRMEQRSREKAGSDVAKYLELKWLDADQKPVTYNTTSGKPPWKLPFWIPEPETESSDCESDENSDEDEW